MSSFARIYGIEKMKKTESFHIFALEWCDEHEYVCNVHLDDLNKVDAYFKQQYESWNN